MPRLPRMLGSLAVIGTWLWLGTGEARAQAPSEAAAPSQEPSFAGRIAFVYLSPGLFTIPVGNDVADELLDMSYQWGLGGGAFLPVGKVINVGIGLGLEHAPFSTDGEYCGLVAGVGVGDCTARANMLRILPEFRLGAGRKRVFGYGFLAPGLAISTGRVRSDTSGFEADVRDTDLGFVLGFGGGAQYMVWRQLSLGGELGFDLAFMAEKDEDDLDFGDVDEGYGLHTFDLKLTAAWWF